ncbi:MAG: TIGR01620 family protein [Pseudomonadota bacterium]
MGPDGRDRAARPAAPRQGPVLFEDTDRLPAVPDPDDETEAVEQTAAGQALAATGRAAARSGERSMASRLFWLSAAGVLALSVGLALNSFIGALFARAAALGWVGATLVALLVAGFVAFALRELAGMARLGRVEALREAAERGIGGATTAGATKAGAMKAGAGDGEPDADAAREALAGLERLYRARPDVAPGLAALKAAEGDTPAPAERLALADRLVVAPLDAQAQRHVERAAREVAAATAVIPLPVLDVALVLWSNLRMLRRVAETYDGRGGWLGSWRLLRAVAAHLVATGALSATDELLGPVLGQGLLATLSRRVGEAALNAGLTARVGAAAIAVCRPLPHIATEAPRAPGILAGAIGDWRPSEGGKD